ncbi:hypothetical protein CJF42_12085 [Pseudoalteromonas sp. NBT06-2]|uniref:EpsG family protein n=1 Tax=Pseudoalteromonas sp. NBT06-2 TaxID=2025950 RepID=UPI000BA5327A|nr:EpsG family protein [Pseudoalteromonas sp. NBT06-2]PAJ74133.1 hypothetical protein CJF42_12085 [Pseudoalteromonas sp. NBT06-2]
MILYFLYASSYFWYFSAKNYKDHIAVLIPILFFWVMLLSLRSESYGEDIKYYFYIFIHPERYYLDEFGLYYFNALLSFFSSEYIWFSLCYSLLINSLLIFFYRYLDRNAAILMFLYFCSTFIFYQLNLNIFRQGVAVVLVLFSITLFSKHASISIMILVLAILFHKAAIIGVVFLFFQQFDFKKALIIPTVLLSIFPIGPDFYAGVAGIIGQFIPIMERALNAYVEMGQQGLIESSDLNHRNLPIIVTALLLLKAKLPENIRVNSIVWVYILSLLFSALLTNNVLLYDRVIIFSQLLQPFVFMLSCKAIFPNRWMVPFIFVAVLQFIFTVSIWGPQNLLPTYDFYKIL